MKYAGDHAAGVTIFIPFNSFDPEDGSLATIDGAAAVQVLAGDGSGATQPGATLSLDVGSSVGSHMVAVDTTGYTRGQTYSVRLSGGTVAGTPVAGTWIATFSIERQYQRGDVVPSNNVQWLEQPITTPLLGVVEVAEGLLEAAEENPIHTDARLWAGEEITSPLETSTELTEALLNADNRQFTLENSVGLNISTSAASSGLDAAGVRAAIGLDAANLDAQLAAKPGIVAIETAISEGLGELNDLSITEAQAAAEAAIADAQLATGAGVTAILETIGDLNDLSASDAQTAASAAVAAAQLASQASVTAIGTAIGELNNLSEQQVENIVSEATEGLATSDQVAPIQALAPMIEISAEDGNRFNARALELAPTGSGGGGITLEQLEQRTLPSNQYATAPSLAAVGTAVGELNNLSASDVQGAAADAIAAAELAKESDLTPILESSQRFEYLIEDNGSGGYRYTSGALSEAPTGDASISPADIEQIRLGLALEETLIDVKTKTDSLNFETDGEGSALRVSVRRIANVYPLRNNGTGGQSIGG